MCSYEKIMVEPDSKKNISPNDPHFYLGVILVSKSALARQAFFLPPIASEKKTTFDSRIISKDFLNKSAFLSLVEFPHCNNAKLLRNSFISTHSCLIMSASEVYLASVCYWLRWPISERHSLLRVVQSRCWVWLTLSLWFVSSLLRLRLALRTSTSSPL